MFYCPCCGDALNFDSKVFVNGNRAVIGCEYCLEAKDAEYALEDMNDY